MAIITKHTLVAQEQAQVERMIREAVTSGQGMLWDGHDDDEGWKPGLTDFVPMLKTTGYYPQNSRNGFDDRPARTMDCPEFAQQAAQALDVLRSCTKVPGGAHHIDGSSWGIAESITCKTGRSMCIGAVVLAALTAGLTLTTDASLGDELFIEGISLDSLHAAINRLKREVAHA